VQGRIDREERQKNHVARGAAETARNNAQTPPLLDVNW
jgi:hypothetical protein